MILRLGSESQNRCVEALQDCAPYVCVIGDCAKVEPLLMRYTRGITRRWISDKQYGKRLLR